MTELPPNWAFKIYSILWKKFGTKKFEKPQAGKLMKENNLKHSISHLKRLGWLTISINEIDSRRNNYKLKDPKIAIIEAIDQQTRTKLEKEVIA